MKSVHILVLLLLSVSTAISDPYTDYILKAEARANGNIYSSSFTQIGNYKNCCPKYESAFGVAPALFLGAEVRNVFNLFGYTMNYSVILGYNDLSAGYKVNQYIGNDIGTDSYQKINVEHQLDLTLPVLFNEHSLWFNPVQDLPLGIKLGINLGIPLSKNFVQKELLIDPADATFVDGTREFNPAKAELPNASSLLYGIGVGARYLVTKFSDYELYANANFNYGLNNIASNLNWNIHQASLGIALHYNIPKSDPPRPPVPPVPQAPEPTPPPIAMKPEMKIETEFDYKKVNNGDTLKITITKSEYITYASVLPVLIFEKNSEKVIKTNFLSKDLGNIYEGNLSIYEKINVAEKYPEIIAEHIKNVPGCRINIVSESDDEDKSIINMRAELITQKLISAGVDKSIITAELRQNNPKKEKNPAITEESRKVFFEFSKGGGLIETKVSTDYMVDNFNKVLNIKPIYSAEKPFTFTGKTTFNGSSENILKDGVNQVVMSSSMFVATDNKPNIFEIETSVKDAEQNIAADKAKFYLKSEEKILKTYINLNKNSNENDVEEFILGYMPFDKSEFSLINNFALDYIRAKATEGRTLEIIPLTDNIGTPEYNEALSRKRAKSAVDLIGNNFTRFVVNLPTQPIFLNDSPYGRMMNRSVIVRIK
jgi:outer membrane protein OmpA-like peptidoglycan-associated protein